MTFSEIGQAAAGTNRREFLGVRAGAAGAALLSKIPGATPAEHQPGSALIDVNVNLSRWPLRRLSYDDPDLLARKLRAHGVIQAWSGSFEALLHRDLAGVNARLAADCRRRGGGLLLPFGSVDPTQSDWEEELRRCADVHRMPGVRLYPNYHGYRLDDFRFTRLLQLAAERKLIVQLALVMEDERMMHPVLRVEPVETGPLGQALRQAPGVRLVLLNALRTLHGRALRQLVDLGNVYLEFSMLEGVGGLEHLIENIPANRVLFGSYAPLFYFEAAELKLKESALSPEHARWIRSENAQRLLG